LGNSYDLNMLDRYCVLSCMLIEWKVDSLEAYSDQCCF
jgi:hypothetical protein